MKKLLLAILVFTLSTGAMFAQTTKPAQEKHKTAKKTATATQQQASTTTAATAAPATGSTVKKVKKDGTPDKRYKENKHLKKDGTADKRFKENKDKKE
ncbi:MAG: hypothetical protein J0I84_21750 [Terrimonas sp.]|uniref:hypothetical protein n=1 Tax=Terrimonas sp. TaxID=1914338 RepID=UPI00092AAFCC|nr:hypothetical protein [Terrimonas sp.]MBN8789713.1 hypothetical protein [Terrimonas sp.]OJY90964.1 MAG: hypothetical protein BGP13_12970 [Sphingobacteriales bacterium 40-81]PVD50868.1 hypothetical protein DC498_18055 [Terrimonas sp.]